MKVSLIARHGALIALAATLLAGCGGNMGELDQYINEVKARPGGRIEPIPDIEPYESFTYVADAQQFRSPFVPDRPEVTPGGGLEPERDRPKEYLEGFSLDTLNMVGTMNIGETAYGLVQTSDGLVHRVLPGQYMGQNDGRIVQIDDSHISLIEIISDGIGGYIERDAAISLAD